jgi:hypothetical protein
MGLAPIGDNAARDLVSIQAEGDGEWMSKHPNWIKAFVTAPVHKHAEVLALAIKTYKESSGV